MWCYGQNLGLNRSNVLKKAKKLALSIDFFIFCMANTFKWLEIPEWKFQVNIARNTTMK